MRTARRALNEIFIPTFSLTVSQTDGKSRDQRGNDKTVKVKRGNMRRLEFAAKSMVFTTLARKNSMAYGNNTDFIANSGARNIANRARSVIG
jgi:hypothetical protein